MNIDELEAGRELDALVAEKVMGWHVTPRGRCISPGYNPDCYKGGYLGAPFDVPKYSTDIAAAWEAHRKIIMPSTELAFNYARELEIAAGACWGGNDCNVLDVLRYLTPLAICRAALKALEKNAEMRMTT